MSRIPFAVATAALAFFTATALAQQPGSLVVELEAPPLDVRLMMQKLVNPLMLGIWDVSNNAMDEEGGLDPAQLDDAKWARLATESEKLAAGAKAMAAAPSFVAASPNNQVVGDGEVSMALVQGHIDEDPAGFRDAMGALAEHAGKVAVAAKAQDAATTGTLIGEMDAVCESCHSRYWYPE